MLSEVRVVGYVRIAPRERPSSRPSLAEQRDAIRAECERRGWVLTRIERDVRSGRTLGRPGLQAALASCRSREADAVMVARLDRLTYSLVDLAELVAEASERGFNIVAPDVGVDLVTPPGQLLAAVLRAAAGWERRRLVRRTRAVLAGRRAEAARPGRPSSTPPEVADRIRALRMQGATLQAICDVLNDEGVPTPRGGSHWRPTSLRSILRRVGPGEREQATQTNV